MGFTDEQIEALNQWARTQPTLRGVFPYTNLQGIERNIVAGEIGLGDLLANVLHPGDVITGEAFYFLSGGELTSGESNTASNLGGGEGIFSSKSGVDLRFKSLVAGTGVSLSSSSDEITIDTSGGGGFYHIVVKDDDTVVPTDSIRFHGADFDVDQSGSDALVTLNPIVKAEAFYIESGANFFTDASGRPVLQGDNSNLVIRTGPTITPSASAQSVIFESPIYHTPPTYTGASPDSSPLGGYSFINVDGTVDATGQSNPAVSGYNFSPIIRENTQVTFGAMVTFNADQDIQNEGSGTNHTGFLLSGFQAQPRITIGANAAVRAYGGISYLAGFTSNGPTVARADGITSGTITVGSVYGFQTNPDFGALRALTQQVGAGATVTEYVHYQAGSGGNHFQVSGSGTLVTEYGIRLENISSGATKISLWSDSATATMRHAGNVRIGDTTAPTVDLEVVGEVRVGDGVVGTPTVSFLSDTDLGLYRVGANRIGIAGGSGGQAFVAGQVSSTQCASVPDGSLTVPGLNFISDTNTGIRRPTTDSLNVVCGGGDVIACTTAGATVTSSLASTGSITGATTFSYDAISPAQITGDVDDYSAIGANSLARLNSDASRTIGGIVGPGAGIWKQLWIVNVGSFNIVLEDEGTSGSAAANQFRTPAGANVTLTPNRSAFLIYDQSTLKWRILTSN